MLWAQLNQNVYSAKNRLRDKLFFEIFCFVLKGQKFNSSRKDEVLRSEIGSKKKDQEKSSPEVLSHVWFLSIYMKE